MGFLENIPANVFETAGLIVGIGANIVISIQVFKEYKSSEASSLSLGYVIGWWLIFLFWLLYGLRFDALAITISNGLATLIQTILILVVVKKKKRFS
jgi:uncharacterized protein with PQ loop repeat